MEQFDLRTSIYPPALISRSKNSISQDLFLALNSARLTYECPQKFSLLRLGGRGFQTEAVFEVPGCRLLCSCDGVLLLKGSIFREFLLWNPSCGKMTRFYYPYGNDQWTRSGLCHDPTNEDLKIVVLSRKCYGVYSCKNRSWMRGSKYLIESLIKSMGYEPGVSVCGAVYWVSMGNSNHHSYSIVYFDSKDDEIKTLHQPEVLKETDEIFLISLGDRLGVWFNNVVKSMVEIWIKEKDLDRDSWMEFIVIDNFPSPVDSFRPLHFRENKILIRGEDTRYLMYCPCEKTFEEFEYESKVVLPYVDGLLFFSIHKALPQRKRKSTYSRLQ